MPVIKVGDVVMLKSGGPSMTVNQLSGDRDEQVTAHWFSGLKQEFFASTFCAAQLKVVPETA